jgi:hypothetical protein
MLSITNYLAANVSGGDEDWINVQSIHAMAALATPITQAHTNFFISKTAKCELNVNNASGSIGDCNRMTAWA